ncbi:MAG TPA: hypothetical protein P5102_08940 [Candidatus Competibacteraceae bacterium]|nr:hypothetical protein [Candidatus Competibacteraceae bacterium]HRZ06262.1 hypothetical protein [Candidatus Competibacteraceae bacterium]HSA47258.1 hypothetical protein [Candidatus Competibacteraceae bacterium]
MPETVAKTNSMAKALKWGEPTTVAVLPTRAEGTAVSKSGKITYPIVRDLEPEKLQHKRREGTGYQ